MHDAAAFGEGAVQFQVRRHIAGGTQIAFNNMAVKIDDDHIFGFHGIVRNAGRFDDEQTFLTVDSAHIAPGECDQVIFGQQQIGFAYSFF